jgi:hypothetical protein
MNTPTAGQLQALSDDEVLDFLVEVLKTRMTLGPGQPGFLQAARELPAGLRAMVTTHHLDVSLTRDNLGWHFGNWHDEELALETAQGLDVLGADELASLFREAFAHAQEHWQRLGDDNWSEWYHGSSLEQIIDPLNTQAWEICERSWNGILGHWVAYARKNPVEVGARHDA